MKGEKPRKVNLISSVIFREEDAFKKARDFLEDKFGGIDYISPLLPFNFTDYYNEEMGSPLFRYILSFSNLFDPEGIYKVKLITNSFERETSRDGKRIVNIDPGYVSLNQLVLFTTKNYAHRIYLGEGIYADLTLIYRKGTFHPLPWTYPDYGSEEYIKMFNKIRSMYKEKLRYDG